MDLIFKVVMIAEFIALFVTDIAFSANCPNIQNDVPTFMNCQYRCHCKANAQCVEQNGKCTNGCYFGWMGPGCQYRNIVKNNWKSARQYIGTSISSDFAIVAVDGDNTTCSRTGNQTGTEKHYWYIPFDMTYDVLGIRIVVPPQDVGNFRNFRIDSGERLNKIDYPTLCYRHANSSINTTMEIMCRKSIKSKRLRIKLDEPGVLLRLCEVEIYGGRSVTFNKNASQKSTYKSTFSWSASKAVDGKIPATASEDADRTCSASGYSPNPWWRVDLETPYVLYEIQFFGRLDRLEQFRGFQLRYSNSSKERQFTELFDDKTRAQAYQPMRIPINQSVTAEYLQFQFKKKNSLLAVCEVIAFAECPKNKCGWDCSEQCYCSTETTGRYKIDGTCPDGCQGRWTGVNGRCNHECKQTKWGTTCQHMCGHCEGTHTCDLKTGECKAGCGGPWVPPLCTEGCPNYKYGINCTQSCGTCYNNTTCNSNDGTCVEGCQLGWKPPNCQTRCDSRTFGFNCSRLCGECINDSTCHFQTGICEKGCKAGFQTAYCNELCDEGTYGEQCKRICGHCSGNDPCDSVTGVCQHSCAAGYTGRLCNEEVPSKTGLIMGAAGAVVVIVAVIAFIVVVKRKRRQPNIYSQEMIAPATTNSLEVSKKEPKKIVPTRNVPSVATPEENVYGNAVADNNDINVAQLRMVATAAISDPKPFYADFEVLPYGLHGDVSAAKRHNSRNKYKNMYPYNFNRVILPSMKGVPDSSYINASYINGFSEPKKYIAAQGPIKTTIDDIWRMVWSHNVRIIVMLTNCSEAGKSKCEQYWPNEHLSHTYGNINVDSTHLDVFADFCIRKFKLTESGTEEQRTVIQFHYTAWPDKDVPDTALSLVQFWRAVRNDRAAKTVPWIVHCSAGVGRTGTFIGLDFLYEQGGALGVVNVKGGVNTLRQQRVNMVQTKEQYVLLHETLAEVFNPIGSIYKNEEFVKQITALVPNSGVPKKAMQDEYTAVCASSQAPVQPDNENVYYNVTEGVSSEAKKPINLRKSRYPDIYPDDLHRPLLSRIPIKGHNDFINAVFVSTFRQLDRLILTQVPLNNTVVDFVRMLWDTNTSTIVLLEDSINDDCCYWPLTTRSFNIGPIKCDVVEQKQCDHYMVRTLKYTTNISYIQDKEKVVRQFHVNSWFPDQTKPETTRCILGLVAGIEENIRFDNQSQIIIQCMDGAKKSGLFCVLWSVIERMRSEREVCMAETVRLCRRRRRQIIHDFEQYTYCYNAVKDYLDNVELYSNLL